MFVYVSFFLFFFFFKQKTAYEMRISDWSSDVCSSDLALVEPQRQRGGDEKAARLDAGQHVGLVAMDDLRETVHRGLPGLRVRQQIGRASCRGRVCQYV